MNGTNGTWGNGTWGSGWSRNESNSKAFDAASVINSLTLTDFCSTLLGYSTPVVTSYVPVTLTDSVTATITESADVTLTESVTETTTESVNVTVTESVNQTVTYGTLTSGVIETTTTVTATLTITSAGAHLERLRRRDETISAPLTTPDALTAFADSDLSMACSWKAKPVSTTSTVIVTITETESALFTDTVSVTNTDTETATATETVSETSTETETTTIYTTVPESTVPASTAVETATSTTTVNSCEPTAPNQLIRNPSFECGSEGWDLGIDYTGAVLYQGPAGVAAPEFDAQAQAFVQSQEATNSSSSSAPTDDSASDTSDSSDADTSDADTSDTSDAGASDTSDADTSAETESDPARRLKRDDDSSDADDSSDDDTDTDEGVTSDETSTDEDSSSDDTASDYDNSDDGSDDHSSDNGSDDDSSYDGSDDDGSESAPGEEIPYLPDAPAYDGSTFVRITPISDDHGGLGQLIDNLEAGSYWMAYKYRVPYNAWNNDQCTLDVYVNGILVEGPGINNLTEPTGGWQRAGGFFTIPNELSGMSYLWMDFYCPPLSYEKRQSDDGSDGGYGDEAVMPLIDIDYIRMGVDNGGWAQYRGDTPDSYDADAAAVSADVANDPTVTSDGESSGTSDDSSDDVPSGEEDDGSSSDQEEVEDDGQSDSQDYESAEP